MMNTENENSMDMGGEYRTGPVAGTVLVKGVTFKQKALQYAVVDGMFLVEGDMRMPSPANSEADGSELPQWSIGHSDTQRRWPSAKVPYDIDPTLPNPQRIIDAIAHWEAKTRLRFILRTAANQAQYSDYVHFIPSTGCWSYVGRLGGKQDLGLGNNCSTGNAIHEIGHAIGLWHEQSREDRDMFVRIIWANIDPSAQHNFNQHITDGDDIGPYDYGSIMHYPATAFSINGQPTIVPLQPLPPGVVMGQRNGLSQGDINGVHSMYPPPVTIKEVRKDPISDIGTIKEVIRDTIKEVRKDPIFDIGTIKEVGRDPIQPRMPIQPLEHFGTTSDSPFVTGIPSRAPQAIAMQDPFAEVAMRVQELAASLAALEQQRTELLAAYNEAVQAWESLVGGQL